jgi:hypothetical protein
MDLKENGNGYVDCIQHVQGPVVGFLDIVNHFKFIKNRISGPVE